MSKLLNKEEHLNKRVLLNTAVTIIEVKILEFTSDNKYVKLQNLTRDSATIWWERSEKFNLIEVLPDLPKAKEGDRDKFLQAFGSLVGPDKYHYQNEKDYISKKEHDPIQYEKAPWWAKPLTALPPSPFMCDTSTGDPLPNMGGSECYNEKTIP